MLTWKSASRHNGVHFFDVSTSKSAPNLVCFVHFDLEMCLAPQRRPLFRHLNFQKRSDTEVLCIFLLGHVLRATTACTFSTSQLPKMLWEWCALYILTWTCASRHNGIIPKVRRMWGAFSFFTCKCASCHNGVQLFISHLARWLRTRRFSEPTFRPSGAINHRKNRVNRDFPTFSHLHLLSSHSFSSLIFSLLLLSSLALPTSAFPALHIVGSLTSKLPSTRLLSYVMLFRLFFWWCYVLRSYYIYIYILHYIIFHFYFAILSSIIYCIVV